MIDLGLTLGDHCSKATSPFREPQAPPDGAGRGSNAHSKDAPAATDRQANRSNTTLQREEEPQDEAGRTPAPKRGGHGGSSLPRARPASESQPRALGMGPWGGRDQFPLSVLKHSEGLISAFNMQIRAWAD